MNLTIELVPTTAWNKSLFKSIEAREWKKLKQYLFEKEEKKCWICGDTKNRLEAHEIWSYNQKEGIQKLEAIHHLCSMCHKIKHWGLWSMTDYGTETLRQSKITKSDLVSHFCKVNHCTEKEFKKEEAKALKIYRARNRIDWKQDFEYFSALIKK